MYSEEDFEDIRPYYDHEINPALKRIVSEPVFDVMLAYLFPGQDKNQIKEKLTEVHSHYDFQMYFMYPLVQSILKQTSEGLTYDGFDRLTPGTPYLFVANHRDIVLDSAILQVLLSDHGHATSEITFGSNLMTNQFIIDLGKVNRMFKVNRGGSKMELLRNSQILSHYIRYTISTKKTSIWIAQRPGRTKDGNDRTEAGLLKMFNMSSKEDFIASFSELNIVPLAISYEYEPCCAAKINELLGILANGIYQKKPGEDLQSIISGIMRFKGRIHLSAGRPVNSFIENADEGKTTNDKISRLAGIIDSEIYSHFKLWPSNYIAFDILNQSTDKRSFYTPAEAETFRNYMDKEIEILSGDRTITEELFLKLYANPVINSIPKVR
jgi:hypothetical protein